MQEHEDFRDRDNPYAAPRSAPVEPSDSERGPFQPFLSIWTHPRYTVRRLAAENPDLHVVLLTCLAGMVNSLDRASTRNAGDKLPLSVILGIVVVFGPLFGLFGLWLMSHLIRLTGAWIGGVGIREHIKTAIAWATVPSNCTLPLWGLSLLLLGSKVFTAETPSLDAQPILCVVILTIGLIEIVLGIWSFVLMCNTIAEVQGFSSAWAGLGNLLLAGLLVAGPLFIIAFVLIAMSLSNMRV